MEYVQRYDGNSKWCLFPLLDDHRHQIGMSLSTLVFGFFPNCVVKFVETLAPLNTTAGTALGVAAAIIQIALYPDDLAIFARGPH